MDEDRFWKQTPKTILIYFEAAKQKEKKRAQELWMIGAYVKQALASTILVAGLADKSTHNKMPKFPDCPYKNDVEREWTEEQKEYERFRLVQYLNSFSSNNNSRNMI